MTYSSIFWYPPRRTDSLPVFIQKQLKELSQSKVEESIPLLCDVDASVHKAILELIECEQTQIFPNQLQQTFKGVYEDVWEANHFKYFSNEVEAQTFSILSEDDRDTVNIYQSKLAYYEKDYRLPDWDLAEIRLKAVVEQKNELIEIPLTFLFSPLASEYCYKHIIQPQGMKVHQLALVRARPLTKQWHTLPVMTIKILKSLIEDYPSFEGIWSDRIPIRFDENVFRSFPGTYIHGWGLVNSTSRHDRYVRYFKLYPSIEDFERELDRYHNERKASILEKREHKSNQLKFGFDE